MLDLYMRQYLLEKSVISNEDAYSPEKAEPYLERFKEEYALSDGDIAAIKSGEMEQIIPVFLHFDGAGALEANLKAYQTDNDLSDHEMESLWKSGKILQILPEYIHSDPMLYNRFVRTAIDNVRHFISDRLILRKARQMRTYDFLCLACQEIKGAHHIFIGISGSGESLAAIAGEYTGKAFQGDDKLAYDSICELINCVTGLFASELSKESVAMDIVPPRYFRNGTVSSNGLLYCLPAVLVGAAIDIVFIFDSDFSVDC